MIWIREVCSGMIACELPAIYVFPFWNFCYIIKQYVTMKVIKWADTGASLLDPVPAHLITPKYEHELPSGNGKCGAACLCC